MAQRSLPQAGSSVGDSGPYTSDEWAEYFQVVYTGDQEATQGVLLGYANELEVAHSAGLNMTVETGAGICYGHFFVSDAQETLGTTTNIGNPSRTDRVVMCQNNTNANYNGTVDYGVACVTPTVQRNSCRLAILTGDTVTGNARALETGPNAYMVELGRFIISGANVISSVTDYRDYCQFSSEVLDDSVSTDSIQASAVTPAKIANRTRRFFVEAYYGYNDTDGQVATHEPGKGWTLTDAKDVRCYGHFFVPDDFYSTMTVTAVVRGNAVGGGDIYSRNSVTHGACDESNITHTASVGYAAVALNATIGYNSCIQAVSLANAATGDIVDISFIRDATDVSDDLDDDAYFPGWIVSYTADS